MDRLIAHPHLRVATVSFPSLGIAVPESRKEAAVRVSLLVSLPRVVLWASEKDPVWRAGGVEDPCPKTASEGFSPSLSLFFFHLFFPHCLLLSIFTNGVARRQRQSGQRTVR